MKKVSILFTIVSLLMQNIHAQTNPLSFDDSLKNRNRSLSKESVVICIRNHSTILLIIRKIILEI